MTQRKRTKAPVKRARKTAKPRRASRKTKVGEEKRLRHALEVHRVELELQNEEIRGAREVAEDALARFAEVFEFAPVGYVVLDSRFAIREVNLAATRLLGSIKARLVGLSFLRFVGMRWLTGFTELMTRIRGTGTGSLELDLVRKLQHLPVRLTASVLMRGEARILIAFEDISERRMREQQLAEASAALRNANHRKDEFIAMLSHELRNPLSSIRATVEAMTLVDDGAQNRRALTLLDRATSHLTRLVDDLLDLTRITRGKVTLERGPLELTGLIRDLTDEHARPMAAKGVELETRLPRDEVWVDADRERLAQVFHNLLGNAEKFTTARGKVTVSIERVGEMVRVAIADTGVGIPHHLLDRVFEPFEQGPQAIDRTGGGLGLGLATVKALVEMHGGSVSIASAGPGQGAAVTVALDTIEPPVVEPPKSPTVAQAGGMRVMIVEDKVDVAESLKYALSAMGHDVAAVHDGRAALDMARSFRPEVVLCDLGLPGIDGYAVARQFRSDDALRHTYLISLSGYARPEDIARSRAAGFEQHVSKPPRLSELNEILLRARPPNAAAR